MYLVFTYVSLCVCTRLYVKVWAVDLQKNEMIVKDVILVAQGEMALEEFLKQVQCTQYSVSFICKG